MNLWKKDRVKQRISDPMTKDDARSIHRPKGLENAEIVLRNIQTPLARRIGFFLMHAMDLNFAAQWFAYAIRTSKKDFIGQEAYVHAALVAYRRCCNEGQRKPHLLGHGPNVIRAEDAERVMPGDGARIHNEMFHLATRLVAHSLPAHERAAVGARCLLDRERGLNAFVDVWGFTGKLAPYGSKDVLKDYGLLCYLLEKNYVRPEVDRMCDCLTEELLRKRPNELFTLPICMIDVEGGPRFNPVDRGRKYPLPARQK